jgi:hypothetical protein
MAGMPRTHVGRASLPAGNDIGAASHGNAIVKAEITILLAHAAPVGRVKRRGHAESPVATSNPNAFPLYEKMFYSTKRSAFEA